jgi:SAM-dependent MidA family methyltransferase
MEPTLERRADPRPSLDDVGEDEALLERIRDEIRRDGPMPFARFMELALYDPDGGYYRAPAARPGRAGDFLTAPELHPIFGATLATGIVEVWERLGRPDPFVIREHGAGTGALAEAILGELAAADAPMLRALRYQPVEVDPRRGAAFRAALTAAGFGSVVEPATTTAVDGIVLANEVLDALPVHRVRRRGAALRELAVDVDPNGALVEAEIDPTTTALGERLDAEGVHLVDGQTAEVGLAGDAWIAGAAEDLRRGLLLIIDYGAPATELFDPVRRKDGTLRAYVRHQVHADPYRHVGRQDLTAHVDVTAVERAAHAAGLTSVGVTTQAEALIGLGIEARLQRIQADPSTTFEGYALVRSALLRLLDPAAMGRFRVLAFGRDWPAGGEDPPLAMFAYHLPRRAGA